MKLADIMVNEEVIIVKIELPDKFKKRLYELGFYEGVSARVVKNRKRAFIVLSVKETYYALRYKDAEFIEVTR